MAPVLKTGIPETVSGVRIPSLPPFFWFVLVSVRRDGRVAEGARLESVYRLIPYRGFESPSLRHFFNFGSRGGFEPVRPEAERVTQ
jgi:hypothetical protein